MPIVTLLTDFGTTDSYVAELKARVLAAAPDATLVDVTHAVPPGDVRAAAYLLGRTWHRFPWGPCICHRRSRGRHRARRAGDRVRWPLVRRARQRAVHPDPPGPGGRGGDTPGTGRRVPHVSRPRPVRPGRRGPRPWGLPLPARRAVPRHPRAAGIRRAQVRGQVHRGRDRVRGPLRHARHQPDAGGGAGLRGAGGGGAGDRPAAADLRRCPDRRAAGLRRVGRAIEIAVRDSSLRAAWG
jgi:hypothetical protein